MLALWLAALFLAQPPEGSTEIQDGVAMQRRSMPETSIDLCLTRLLVEDRADECIYQWYEYLRDIPISEMLDGNGGKLDALSATMGADPGKLLGDAYADRTPPPSDFHPAWIQVVAARDHLVVLFQDLVQHITNEQMARAEAVAQEIRDRAAPTFLHEFQEIDALTSGRYAMVVRGGISMGIYQAGFLYYLSTYLRDYQKALHAGVAIAPFEVVAGTSAGGMNALGVALESCRKETPAATQSLFYKMWIDVGLVGPRPTTSKANGEPWVKSGLYDLAAVQSTSLLSPAPIDEVAGKIADVHVPHGDRRDDPGDWLEDCDVILGLTSTRVDPRTLGLGGGKAEGGIDLPHQLERFGFSVRTMHDQRGAWLAFENFQPEERHPRDGIDELDLTSELRERYPALAFDGYQSPLHGVLSVAKATGAVPLVFPPVEVDMTYQRGNKIVVERAVPLADGGVYDNRPFGYAARLRHWRPDSDNHHDLGTQPFEFIMLEPAITAYREEVVVPVRRGKGKGKIRKKPTDPSPIAARSIQRGAFPILQGLAVNFLKTGTSNQLLEAADEYPYLRVSREKVNGDFITKLPARGQPVASEQLFRFLGFAERDFREFDYYVGIVDAMNYVESHPIWQQAAFHADLVKRHTDSHSPIFTDYDRLRIEVVQRSRKRDFDPKTVESIIAESLEKCKDSDCPDFEEERRKRNFMRLVLVSRACERNYTDRSIDVWFQQLEARGFEYIDLPKLGLGTPHGQRRLGKNKQNWEYVAGLLREALGNIGNQFAEEQDGMGQKLVWRTALDYGLDGLFRYRFDHLLIDVTPFGATFGLTGRHSFIGLDVAGYVGGAVLGHYLALNLDAGLFFWRRQEQDFNYSNRFANQWGLGVEYFFQGPGDMRKGSQFSVHRGLWQWEIGVATQAHLFHVRPDEQMTLRWGPRLRLGFVFARRLTISLYGRFRLDGCRRQRDWCFDQRDASFLYTTKRRHAAVDDWWQIGLAAAVRFRPIADQKTKQARHEKRKARKNRQ